MEKTQNTFFRDRTNWFYIVSIIFVLLVSVVGFFLEEFSYKAIVAMFAIIASENFIIQIISLESIRDKMGILQHFSKDDVVIKKTDGLIEVVNTFIKDAQKEVVLIGGSMKQLYANEIKITALTQKQVNIGIMALDIRIKAISDQYSTLIGKPHGILTDLNHLDIFSEDKNIKIQVYDFLPTAYYIGVDLKEADGKILVFHILHGLKEDKYPHTLITRSNSYWYDIYEKQIYDLWDNGKEWK